MRPSELTMVVILVFVITACRDNEPPPQLILQQLQTPWSEQETTAFSDELADVQHYVQATRPDPFWQKIYAPVAEPRSTAAFDDGHCVAEHSGINARFSEYSIEHIQLRGVMLSAQQAAQAIVMTPDLQWHQVMIGDYIASSYSRITQITQQAILLESTETGGSGCDRLQIYPLYLSNAYSQFQTSGSGYHED